MSSLFLSKFLAMRNITLYSVSKSNREILLGTRLGFLTEFVNSQPDPFMKPPKSWKCKTRSLQLHKCVYANLWPLGLSKSEVNKKHQNEDCQYINHIILHNAHMECTMGLNWFTKEHTV